MKRRRGTKGNEGKRKTKSEEVRQVGWGGKDNENQEETAKVGTERSKWGTGVITGRLEKAATRVKGKKRRKREKKGKREGKKKNKRRKTEKHTRVSTPRARKVTVTEKKVKPGKKIQ